MECFDKLHEAVRRALGPLHERLNRHQERLHRIENKLDLVLALLGVLKQGESGLMANLDDVLAQVTAMKDVEDGLGTALDQIIAQEADIKARLDAAIASGDPAKVQAVSDALGAQTADLQAKKQRVLDAVTANT
jgi:hypothetical protein